MNQPENYLTVKIKEKNLFNTQKIKAQNICQKMKSTRILNQPSNVTRFMYV